MTTAIKVGNVKVLTVKNVKSLDHQEQKMSDTEQLLRILADQLGGVLKHYECSDRTTRHKKYVIEYAKETKENNV